jgi:type VI secretion system protein ImpJ
MRNLPVHWSEGMFLRPQHFQAADRHWGELIANAQRWDSHYNYGLRDIQISREALANYQVQFNSCQARTRDGTVIVLEKGQEPNRVDLKPAFAQQTEVTVHLAIPKLAMGRANVSLSAQAADHHRFVASSLSVQDESAGGNDQEIQFRDLNLRVMLSTEDLTGFETLPVARIKRASADEATPELDSDYIPPLLALDAWPPLGMEIVRAIFDVIGEKIEVLSERASGRNLNLSSPQPGDLEDLLMLSVLNESYATLHWLSFAQGVHPFLAYGELCRVVGKLSVFHGSRRLEDIPAYDHDDLARIFKWVKLKIEQLLGSRQKLYFEQRYFVGAERGMQVSLESEWFHSGWEWYVGVNGQNVAESLCRDLLRPGKLDWKMGSSQQIDLIFRHGLPGVEPVELTHPPRELPPHGWIFYQMQRDNAAWKDVLATQTLALRFQEELIGNLENLRGQRRLEVVLPDRRAILEFALFAVPKHQE